MIKSFQFLILFLLFTSCSTLEVPKDILTLERKFIAVWLPSQSCQLEKARGEYDSLIAHWKIFREKYSSIIKNENTKKEVRRSEQWLEEAGVCLKQGDELCVRVKLDQFKFQMQEIRKYWEVDYYIDYLWDFEEDLNRFVEISADPKLDLLEWNEFMPYLKAVNLSFTRLYEKEMDLEFLDYDPDKIDKWYSLKLELDLKLSCLNGLTEGAQIDEIANCAKGIQKTTHEAIALFGNIIYKSTAPEIL